MVIHAITVTTKRHFADNLKKLTPNKKFKIFKTILIRMKKVRGHLMIGRSVDRWGNQALQTEWLSFLVLLSDSRRF